MQPQGSGERGGRAGKGKGGGRGGGRRGGDIGIMKWPQQRPHMSKSALGYDAISSTPQNPAPPRRHPPAAAGGGGDGTGGGDAGDAGVGGLVVRVLLLLLLASPPPLGCWRAGGSCWCRWRWRRASGERCGQGQDVRMSGCQDVRLAASGVVLAQRSRPRRCLPLTLSPQLASLPQPLNACVPCHGRGGEGN